MRLLSTVAFRYREDRLTFLRQVVQAHRSIGCDVDIFVLTDTDDSERIALLREHLGASVNVLSFTDLPNRWYLTWAHKQVLHENFHKDYTHFLYSEDDIALTRANVAHWVENRETLRSSGLYPSFLRVEYSAITHRWVSTDVQNHVRLANAPSLQIDDEVCFVNLPNPYQGLFFYDRDLMREHLESDTFHVARYAGIHAELPEHGGGVAEKANWAQTFVNVPRGFTSRNAVKVFSRFAMIDPGCFVHHLPNNYADDPTSFYGKIPLEQLVYR